VPPAPRVRDRRRRGARAGGRPGRPRLAGSPRHRRSRQPARRPPGLDRRSPGGSLTIVFREVRRSTHGDELRWAVAAEPVANPDGGPPVTRGVFRHPGICVIVPFVTADEVLLIRQYRYPVDAELWEVPAGT